MDVDEAIRHRRSIKRFLPDPVPVTDIREMLALASLAPSIGNRQMWRFIVLTEENLRQMLVRLVERRIDEMAGWPEFVGKEQRIRAWKDYTLHFAGAPAIIFFINLGYRIPIDSVLTERGYKGWEIEDNFGQPDFQSIGGLIGYFTLLAEARGYGTCWITDALIAQHDLSAALELGLNESVAALLSLGRPDEYPLAKPRKSIDDLIEWR